MGLVVYYLKYYLLDLRSLKDHHMKDGESILYQIANVDIQHIPKSQKILKAVITLILKEKLK